MDTTRGKFQMHVKIYLELKFTVEKVKESINSQIKVVNACTNTRIRISPFLRTKKQSATACECLARFEKANNCADVY